MSLLKGVKRWFVGRLLRACVSVTPRPPRSDGTHQFLQELELVELAVRPGCPQRLVVEVRAYQSIIKELFATSLQILDQATEVKRQNVAMKKKIQELSRLGSTWRVLGLKKPGPSGPLEN